ncbi:MAG: CopG family transcriptional regulator [Planctomycetes bacterium]|nr:CopG family transcriptional regulator [Planctomycetota bacterium]
MKQYQVELPDKVADELEALVQAGWFQNQGEAVRMAIVEFVRRRSLDLTEEFQREDIAWALRQKTGAR